MDPPSWTEKDVADRLEAVRTELLDFLRERTRMEWFRHKVRWRLSRRYVWPGSPEGLRAMLDEKVASDPGVEAFIRHVEERQAAISTAIEYYNTAVRRFMEQQLGRSASAFNEAEKQDLRRRRITFQGTRDELLWRGRTLTQESGPELVPELLSLRLAIITEEVRDEIFRDVSAILADEALLADEDLAALFDDDIETGIREKGWLIDSIELQLRCFDRLHAARLLAESYAEARRMLDLDHLLDRHEGLLEAARRSPPSPLMRRLLTDQRRTLALVVSFLEELFPQSASTHERERNVVRSMPE